MKISFTTMATPELDGPAAIRMAQAYGYDGIDLRVSPHSGELTVDSAAADIAEIKTALANEGIDCASLFCYNDCGNEEAASWQKMMDSVCKQLEIAEAVGAEAIRVFTGAPFDTAQAESFFRRTAETLAAAACKMPSDIRILIQNHSQNATAAESAFVANAAGNPRIGIAFSPEHCVIQGQDPFAQLETVFPYTPQLYIADMCKTADGFTDAFPGEGVVPLPGILAAAVNKGFDGWITFKWERVWRRELAAAEIALPAFIPYINGLLQGISNETLLS